MRIPAATVREAPVKEGGCGEEGSGGRAEEAGGGRGRFWTAAA